MFLFSKSTSVISLATLLTLFSQLSYAAESDGSRGKSKWGATVGVGSEPLGALIGFNLHYNVFNFLQARVGYGTASTSSVDPSTGTTTTVTATSLGGGIRAYIPGWNLSPFVGLGFSKVSFTGTFSLGGTSISSTDGLSLTYAVGGLEWQTNYGLCFGLQAQMSLGDVTVPGSSTPIELPIIPGVYIGWFF